MKALVIEGPKTAVIQEVPYPTPGEKEVTIRVKRCGICGTDFHIYQGEFLSPYPLIPGHEFSGVVEEVGPGVTQFTKGDRVAVDPSLFCGECEFCLTHRGNHCVNWGATGDTVNGALAEFVKVPAQNVFKLSNDLSFAAGAMIEPLACVVHGVNRLELKVGQSVLIFGAGSMGQLLTQALSRAGAGELVVVDVDQSKLDVALAHGATAGYLSQNIDQALSHRVGHAGFDVVIDVTGIPAVIETEFKYVAPTGTFMQFGVAPEKSSVSINPFDVYHKDLRIIGSMAINRTYGAAVNWINAGRFDIDSLISTVVSLEEIPALLEGGKASNVMKIQVSFD
ncbi:zinc-dependent alcohol dehydrogenase family protein [Alicyclobacillus dauci]|uniref:Zinc-dependent alcohol dehydrogenase family protein n=1 Tax=Alicyclobacillus dauci TaxID=1475485 RepID=A0ABY6Z502_9BACL|nr:zinc-dependent alcohol dehydrogenase family protein [Alicyclobacillus dauci]WAH37962.1 zinc-dependent alcohol dehydrogenase family protein [Alicyclobacillus dauci]